MRGTKLFKKILNAKPEEATQVQTLKPLKGCDVKGPPWMQKCAIDCDNNLEGESRGQNSHTK